MSLSPDPDVPDAVIPGGWSPDLPDAVAPAVYKVGTSFATAISVQNVRIKLTSLGTDEAEIFLNLNVSASLPTVLATGGALVTIYKDSVAIFVGTVQNRKQTWGATAESQTVKLKGLWDFLERNYFFTAGGYINSTLDNQTVTFGGVTMASALGSLAPLNIPVVSDIYHPTSLYYVRWAYLLGCNYRVEKSDNGGATWTFLANYTPTVANPYYFDSGYTVGVRTYRVFLLMPFALGTVDLEGFNLPDFQLRAFTLADGIRTILRYSPNCVSSFNYSASPPVLNFLKASSSSLTEFKTWEATASGGIPYAVKKFEWTDRDDLKLQRVQLLFWRDYTRAYRSYDTDASGLKVPVEWTEKYMWYEGTDDANAGATASGILMRQMMQLQGSRKDLYIQFHTSRVGSSTAYGTLIAYRGSPFPLWYNLIQLASADELSTYGSWLYVGNNYGSAYSIQHVKEITEVNDGDYFSSPSSWYWVTDEGHHPPKELWATAAFAGFQGVEVQMALTFRQPVPNSNLGFDKSVTIKLWKIPAGYGTSAWFQRIINQDDASLPAVPSGIATYVQGAASSLSAQGTCDVEWNEPIIPGPLARKIVTPTGSVGLIQGIDVDLAAGSVTVTFGPPTQLRPDDVKRLFFAQVDELPGAKTGA